jgi:L-serine deaminase
MSEINFEKLLKDCTESEASIKMSDIKETLELCIAGLYRQSSYIKDIIRVMGKDIATGLLSSMLSTTLVTLYVLDVLKDANRIEEYLENTEETPDKYIN